MAKFNFFAVILNKKKHSQYRIDFYPDLNYLYNIYSDLPLGDSGTISIYAEEHTGLKDTITFEYTGSNLDKKDLLSESDPFFTLSRMNPGMNLFIYYYLNFSANFNFTNFLTQMEAIL